MKRKIAVITGTRAEYGLLKLIIKKIKASSILELKLIVTGTHLSPYFDNTYKEIEKDGFNIDYKVELLVASDTPSAIAKSMGLGMISFAQVYQELLPDIILFLGDRYELLAAASAALPFNIILAHIAGGEITEGIIDDQIRHSLTKLSHIHFACSDFYTENIKKLAEEEWRIHNVGHPGIELIKEIDLISKDELFKTYNLDPSKKVFLVTFHPTTLNSIDKERIEAKTFFEVLKKYKDVNIIITCPNSDTNSHIIQEEIELLKDFINIRTISNLGSKLYLSFMKICDLVLGNSSSGIGESPYFKIPVVNYGDRQKGRLKATNIIDAEPNQIALENAINKALYDKNYRNDLKSTKSIYGIGNTSDTVVRVLEDIQINETLLRKKFAQGASN